MTYEIDDIVEAVAKYAKRTRKDYAPLVRAARATLREHAARIGVTDGSGGACCGCSSCSSIRSALSDIGEDGWP